MIERTYIVEALLVKIMKSRKYMQHTELIK